METVMLQMQSSGIFKVVQLVVTTLIAFYSNKWLCNVYWATQVQTGQV